ncbi:hypothetical protein OsI_12387 [Oryza sativa Indica Group]|uniref:Uncharacterized protein n=1 Tax=Oryza sativa subsp. indica TaxID=39946 RepID=B8AL68_ORYSI|nr:hypothetical protein OsI_12387 [Oryza sativa Indica Group]
MASGSIVKKEVGENHDVLRFGVNNSVKGDLAPQHPIQATVHKEARFWADKKRFGAEAIYGSAFNIRKDLNAQILSKFQRPPGALPSSMLGYEALTGSLDDFGFEDYLNLPQDSDSFHAPDMHHGMEGISFGYLGLFGRASEHPGYKIVRGQASGRLGCWHAESANLSLVSYPKLAAMPSLTTQLHAVHSDEMLESSKSTIFVEANGMYSDKADSLSTVYTLNNKCINAYFPKTHTDQQGKGDIKDSD